MSKACRLCRCCLCAALLRAVAQIAPSNAESQPCVCLPSPTCLFAATRCRPLPVHLPCCQLPRPYRLGSRCAAPAHWTAAAPGSCPACGRRQLRRQHLARLGDRPMCTMPASKCLTAPWSAAAAAGETGADAPPASGPPWPELSRASAGTDLVHCSPCCLPAPAFAALLNATPPAGLSPATPPGSTSP